MYALIVAYPGMVLATVLMAVFGCLREHEEDQ